MQDMGYMGKQKGSKDGRKKSEILVTKGVTKLLPRVLPKSR